MELNGKHVLVTGAGGFIGSHLVEMLVREGARVRALLHYSSRPGWAHLDDLPAEVRAEVDVVAGDVTDPFSMSNAVKGQQVVFHLAALIGIPYSYIAPASYVDTNIRGTVNVLEAARAHGVERFVHTSTSETYGTALYTPIDEKHPMQAQSPYAASKIGADRMAESYQRAFAVPVVTLRPFNTYGPRQSARAVIPTVVSQLLAGNTVRLGNLDPVRDFLFVEDTARAFIAAARADNSVGAVFNAGTGTGISIGDLVSRIAAMLGVEADIALDPERRRVESSEVFELVCDATQLRQATGWAPQVRLDEGLARVIDYVRAQHGQYRPGVYQV